MRVAHCLGWYFPDSVGGTEVYVRDLARGLRAHDVESAVLAPCDGGAAERYEHDGLAVLRYPVPASRDGERHEGLLPHAEFEVFRDFLREARADVFHLHSLTFGANLHHLECARDMGMAAVTTVHTPDVLCERGTLMRFGRAACDGRIDPAQCVPCWLDAKGVPAAIAPTFGAVLQRVPARTAAAAPGRFRTVLGAGDRIARRRSTLLRLAERSGRMVAVCAWLYDALRLNGVSSEKLVLCRQAVAPPDPARRGPLPNDRAGRPLRVGFFGRASPVKGLHVLVDAALRARRASLELTVYSPANSLEDRVYLDGVSRRLAGDPRVRFLAPVPPERVREEMRRYDVIAVPSLWLETGPLVAMEAHAAGIPVLGSDLGGLREIVRPGRTGWLLPPNNVGAWSDALERLAETRPRLVWEPDDAPFPTHDEVARRMVDVYRGLP